jgi:hypothetical protein
MNLNSGTLSQKAIAGYNGRSKTMFDTPLKIIAILLLLSKDEELLPCHL